jgi:hypothetical protein
LGDRLKGADRRKNHVEVTPFVGRQCIDRPEPLVFDRFAGVVRGRLITGRHRHEKSCVVTTRGTNRRHPMGQVGQPSKIEHELFSLQHFAKAQLSIVQLSSKVGQSLHRRRITEIDQFTTRTTGNKQTGLFEEFAQSGHEVRETSRSDAKTQRRLSLIRTERQALDRCVAVARVDTPAGKNVGPAHEVTVQIATKHQHLESLEIVAQGQHRGGRSRNQNL